MSGVVFFFEFKSGGKDSSLSLKDTSYKEADKKKNLKHSLDKTADAPGSSSKKNKFSSLPEFRESLPPERMPTGNVPEGVKPFSSKTLSLSSLKTMKKNVKITR